MTTNTQMDPIAVGTKLVISKGCKPLNMAMHSCYVVESIEAKGAEYSHAVKVVLRGHGGFQHGKAKVMWARHMNRLSDMEINLNDGNPSHLVRVMRK